MIEFKSVAVTYPLCFMLVSTHPSNSTGLVLWNHSIFSLDPFILYSQKCENNNFWWKKSDRRVGYSSKKGGEVVEMWERAIEHYTV